MWKFTNFFMKFAHNWLYLIMAQKKKSKKDKKVLDDKIFIYKLEIAYNEKSGSIEYITESVYEESNGGPIDTNWDYIEDYWDEETLKIFDTLYEVGEAWGITK